MIHAPPPDDDDHTDRPDPHRLRDLLLSCWLLLGREMRSKATKRRGESCKWPQGDMKRCHIFSPATLPDTAINYKLHHGFIQAVNKMLLIWLTLNKQHFLFSSCCNTLRALALKSSGFFYLLCSPRARESFASPPSSPSRLAATRSVWTASTTTTTTTTNRFIWHWIGLSVVVVVVCRCNDHRARALWAWASLKGISTCLKWSQHICVVADSKIYKENYAHRKIYPRVKRFRQFGYIHV